MSLAESLTEACLDDKKSYRKILRLCEGIETRHQSIFPDILKARALRRLGLPTVARGILTSALRMGKGQPSKRMRISPCSTSWLKGLV